MIEDLKLEALPELPEELAELDAELRDLRITVRPSFGPELRTELEREWLRGPPRPSFWPGARRALAASVAGIAFASVAVPQARASLAELSRSSLRFLGVLDQRAESEVRAPRTAASLDASVPGMPEAVPPPLSPRAPAADAGQEDRPAPDFPHFDRIPVTFPELMDREDEQRAIRRYYPERLQAAGIGGTVRVQLWVDDGGAVDNVRIEDGSGEPELDAAALKAAYDLHFVPATRGDRAVGTWVEFDIAFEPREVVRALPTVSPVESPEFSEGLDADLSASWASDAVVPAPYYLDAEELLGVALGDGGNVERRLGSLDDILAGEPPAGVSVLRWRADVTDALEQAMARDPDNPAPFLALGRIRTKQGLRSDAHALFKRGLQRARRGSRTVSPFLIAELEYELGSTVEQDWLPWRTLGRIPDSVAESVRCSRSGTTVEDLIALDYMCPLELDRIMEEGFEPVTPDVSHRDEMLDAFTRAVEAYPAHVAANTQRLLDLADQDRWFEVLNEARRFAWASRGHPYALLLSGLALHRLGRSEEAEEDLVLGLEGLPEAEARDLTDLAPLLDEEATHVYEELGGKEREQAAEAFWRPLDPILTTEVNERRVEHLARAVYAHLRFRGTSTEAGELWVRYGRPSRVRTLGEDSGLRTEFWDYGRGPDVTFRRPATTNDLTLTSEARAYLEDLRQILPHWYRNREPAIVSLPAQLARFQGVEPGSAELAIHTRVPAALATGGDDSLSLGLYLLGPGGTRVDEYHRTIAARNAIVRLPDIDATGSEVAVLELYNPRTRQVAAVRSPVRRNGHDQDIRISDLLLVEPAAPSSHDMTRSDSWIVPRTASGDASGDQLGVLFELYDLPRSQEQYRMRVELESVTDSKVRRLSYRPAGQTLFGEEWSIRPQDASGRSTEFVTLDLSDVGPGDYVLRIRVGLSNGDAPIEIARRVERR